MSAQFDQYYVFEHPGFNDAHDAQRQSRLHGFRYLTDHAKFGSLCDRLKQAFSASELEEAFERPLEAVPDNSALYVLNMRKSGRETVLPTLLTEAVALGFSVLDDQQGRCHCPAGVWSVDGLQPHAQ